MRTLLRNITILALAAAPFVSGCTEEGNEINYNIEPGNELYLPADATAVDLTRGADIEFQWAPSIAYDNGFVSYELLIDKPNGDFSAPLAVMPSQLNGSKTSLSVTAKNMNNVAKAAGIKRTETGDLKWTVRATKGVFGSIYTETRDLTVTAMNSMDPLPKNIVFKGEALEDPEGIDMVVSRGIDKVPATEGTFECFTKIKGATDFTVEDELGRYYALNENGSVTYSPAGAVNNQMPSEAIYWINIDFDVMTWSYQIVTKMEYYAASWVASKMTTVYKTMTYAGKGVWKLLDYENTISDNSENDSRHRFNATLGDGSKLYLGLGPNQNLGTSYKTEYLIVNLYTKNGVGGTDWGSTYRFLTSDCGRKLDCYLYLNGDNPAGTWWHEYKFK